MVADTASGGIRCFCLLGSRKKKKTTLPILRTSMLGHFLDGLVHSLVQIDAWFDASFSKSLLALTSILRNRRNFANI